MKIKIIQFSVIASMFILTGAISTQTALAEADEIFPEGVEPIEVTEESAADAARDEALQSIAANRDEVVAEILALFSSDDENANLQLEVSLQQASPEQLLAAGDAQSLDEVNSILSGVASGEFDDVTVVNMGKLEFVPITPCRIVDTRIVGGQFAPNNKREFYVHGVLAASQGGSTCTSPVGEPKGVMINMAVVPLSGAAGGNFVAYPANVSAPLAGVINYKYGVQNISNASSVKTWFAGGNKDIEVLNRNGYAHLIIDVLGYYADPTSGIDYVSSTGTITAISTSTTTPTKIIETYVATPEDSYCTVNASLSTWTSGTNFLKCNIRQDTNSTPDAMNAPYWFSYDSTGSHHNAIAGTRGFYHPAGGRYYRLQCFKNTGTGNRFIYYPQITVNCTKNRY